MNKTKKNGTFMLLKIVFRVRGTQKEYLKQSIMTEKQLIYLVEVSNKNSQIYDRRKFPNARYEIKSCLKRKSSSFDYSPYVNFER